MRKGIANIRFSAAVTVVMALCSFGIHCDVPDTRNPKAVKIGELDWAPSDLNAIHFRNGDAVPQAQSSASWIAAAENKSAAWCYFKNELDSSASRTILYNWYAVIDDRVLAPEGWHIPREEEWNNLNKHLLRGPVDAPGYANFKTKIGGKRSFDGLLEGTGDYRLWWTSSKHFPESGEPTSKSKGLVGIQLFDISENIFSVGMSAQPESGYAIRLVKD